MNERDTFIRAIAEAWDGSTPVLVFADWAEEHGTDNPALLRWYGWHVMPALAAVPADCPAASDAECRGSYRSLRRKLQGDILTYLAAVAFCRRPRVWNRDGADPVRRAAELARLFALGLVTDDVRRVRYKESFAAAVVAERNRHETWLLPADSPNRALMESFRNGRWANVLATQLLNAAGRAVARTTAGSFITVQSERDYQRAVYAALAAVPPLRIDETPRQVQEMMKEERPRPPMKLPRGIFRRIVVRGHAYGWQTRTDLDWRDVPIEIVVRSADNTGQRLRVRPAPPVVLPGLVARIMGDALDGGWQPTVHDLPDFQWDGTPYLPSG